MGKLSGEIYLEAIWGSLVVNGLTSTFSRNEGAANSSFWLSCSLWLRVFTNNVFLVPDSGKGPYTACRRERLIERLLDMIRHFRVDRIVNEILCLGSERLFCRFCNTTRNSHRICSVGSK